MSHEGFIAPTFTVAPRVSLAEADPDFGSRMGAILVFGAGRGSQGVHQYLLKFTLDDWVAFESVYGRLDSRSHDWTLWHRLVCPQCHQSAFSEPYNNGMRVCLNCSFPTSPEATPFFDALIKDPVALGRSLEVIGRLNPRNAGLVAEVVAGVQAGVEKVTLDALKAQATEKEIAAKATEACHRLVAYGYEQARAMY